MSKTLVYNSKGGVGKSLITREIVAGPKASETVIVEIDKLNKTQEGYKKHFKEVIVLGRENVKDCLKPLISEEHVVVDVGADALSDAIKAIRNYEIFDFIDLIVIPLIPGRSEAQNAIQIYRSMSKYHNNVLFAFNRYKPGVPLEEQYDVFASSFEKFIGRKLEEKDYIVIEEVEEFKYAQTKQDIIANMVKREPLVGKAKEALAAGDKELFDRIMSAEIERRGMITAYNRIIKPLHEELEKRGENK